MEEKDLSIDLKLGIREYLKYYWKEQESEKMLIE